MVYGRPLFCVRRQAAAGPAGRWRGTDVWPGADWIRRRCRTAHNCISSPEVVVRIVGRTARSASTTRLLPHERPQHVAADRRDLPTSRTCAARRRRSTASTRAACCAAQAARWSTCASGAPRSTGSSPTPAPRLEARPSCRRWPAARWPGRRCGAPAARSTGGSSTGRTGSRSTSSSRSRSTSTPTRAACASGAACSCGAGSAPAARLVPAVRRHRRGAPPPRPARPAALARRGI